MPINFDHIVPVLEPRDEEARDAMEQVIAYVWGQVNERCPPMGNEAPVEVARLGLALDLTLTLVGGLTAQGQRMQREIDELKDRADRAVH